jgi:hypothetical protein
MRPGQFLGFLVCACAVFFAACSSPVPPESGRFLQKKPVIVAIIPAENLTNESAASLVLDKIWEESLVNWGCMVVNADKVVAYAGKSGVALESLQELPLGELARVGRELGVDYVMYNTVVDWDTVGGGMTQKALISCVTAMYEARTGAVVWEDSWSFAGPSYASEKALSDAIFALANSSLSTMTNGEAAAAVNGVKYVMDFSMPYPSFEPGTEYSASKWTSRALLAPEPQVTEESPEDYEEEE